jgi:hypothetical protein
MWNTAQQKVYRPDVTIPLINMGGRNSCSGKAARPEVSVVVLWRFKKSTPAWVGLQHPHPIERQEGRIHLVSDELPPPSGHATVKV